MDPVAAKCYSITPSVMNPMAAEWYSITLSRRESPVFPWARVPG